MRKYHRRTWQAPARDVVAKFDAAGVAGVRRLAKVLKVSTGTVYSWLYAKADGGAGGYIPADYHKPILTVAGELGISLTPAELTGLTEFETSPPTRKLSRKSVRSATGDHHPQLQLAAE